MLGIIPNNFSKKHRVAQTYRLQREHGGIQLVECLHVQQGTIYPLQLEGHDLVVISLPNLVLREHSPLRHPPMSPIERLPSIRLEYHPLAGTALSSVNHFVVLLWQLIKQIVQIKLFSHIDLPLGSLQGVEVCPELLVRGVSMNEETDHE